MAKKLTAIIELHYVGTGNRSAETIQLLSQVMLLHEDMTATEQKAIAGWFGEIYGEKE